MLRRVAFVRTDVSEELSAYFIGVTRIGERLLVPASGVPSSLILVTLMKEERSSSETSIVTRAMGRDIPGDTILGPLFFAYLLQQFLLNFVCPSPNYT
jgi:hypothetical protein